MQNVLIVFILVMGLLTCSAQDKSHAVKMQELQIRALEAEADLARVKAGAEAEQLKTLIAASEKRAQAACN